MKARDATGNFIRYLYQRSVVFLFRAVIFEEIKQKNILSKKHNVKKKMFNVSWRPVVTFSPSMFK